MVYEYHIIQDILNHKNKIPKWAWKIANLDVRVASSKKTGKIQIKFFSLLWRLGENTYKVNDLILQCRLSSTNMNEHDPTFQRHFSSLRE